VIILIGLLSFSRAQLLVVFEFYFVFLSVSVELSVKSVLMLIMGAIKVWNGLPEDVVSSASRSNSDTY